LKNAFIEVIPHKLQRYDTSEDYYQASDNLIHFKISKRPDSRHEWLDAMHGQIEAFINELRGITPEQVDKWDFTHPEAEDPGSLLGCPYFEGHMFANVICQDLAKKIGVKWEDYYNEEIK